MDKAELKRITESNRAAWNEVTPYHQRARKDKWDRLFAQPGYVCLSAVELDLLSKAGLIGKSVAYLCCNNGVELLSWKNLGAGECIGFDICDAAIEEAAGRALRSGIDCQFVRSDVYEIGAEYNERFDMVYITVGGLSWMPDLKLFFAKAAALLRENGMVFIHEIHPFADLLPTGRHEHAGSLRIVEPYFKMEPYIDQGYLDYLGNADYPSVTTQYCFAHTLSGIMMSLIDNGFVIEKFVEYEMAVSPEHSWIEAAKAGIPLSYILIGKKRDAEGKRPPVLVTLDGYTYRTTVAVMGGEYWLPLSAERRQAAGVKAGEIVDVTLELDTEPRTVEVPVDLAAALSQRPGATQAFAALSYSQRKEYVRQVELAKAQETRQRRIAGIVDKLGS